MKPLREVYGESLLEFGKANKNVVVLDADLATSTRTVLFANECPDRFFDVGIAEANMASMAAGFAACNLVPFINTFATFAVSMCAMPIKCLVAYAKLNVKIMGGNNGLTGGYDGATHHCFDDINVMRAIPDMLVVSPSDPVMTRWMVKAFAQSHKGPAYASISRCGLGNIYAEDEQFEFGKAKCAKQGTDITIIAYGLSVARALKAAEILEQNNINARVIDMFTIKPIDEECVVKAAKETGAIVTVEEHSVVGGVGTAVAETLLSNNISVPFYKIGIKDCYTQSASYEQLVKIHSIDVEDIVDAAKSTLSKK